tara:strand:+ start:14296 stop:20418 length:6123 start_codon:yes stop_codon:yes gene_type:complete
MAKIKENFSEKQLSVILKEKENRTIGRANIVYRGGYIRMVVTDEFDTHIQTFHSSRGVNALLDELGLGVTRGTTTINHDHSHQYEIDSDGNGVAYMSVHPDNPEVKHQHQIVNYEIQEAESNGYPNTMELYGVDGAPPHQHILITGSNAISMGTGEGEEQGGIPELNVYEDDNGVPYVKPNESLEAIKLKSGNYNLIFDTLRNVLSQIFGITEEEAKHNYPFVIKNISPSRKEVRLVFDGDENINLDQLQLSMPEVVGRIDDTRANDEDGNLIQNGISEAPVINDRYGIKMGGQFLHDGATFFRNIGFYEDFPTPEPGMISFSTGTDTDDDGTNDLSGWPYNQMQFMNPIGNIFAIEPSFGVQSGMSTGGQVGGGTFTTDTLEAYVAFIGSDSARVLSLHDPAPSAEIAILYWDGLQWTYDNSSGYDYNNVFIPNEDDCLLARLYRPGFAEPPPPVHSQGIQNHEVYFTYGSEPYEPSGLTFYEEYDLNADGILDNKDRELFIERGQPNAAAEIQRFVNGVTPYPFHNYQFDYMLNIFMEDDKTPQERRMDSPKLLPILNYLIDDSQPGQKYLILKLSEPLPITVSRLEKVTIDQKILETSTEQIKYFQGSEKDILMRPLPYDPSFVKEKVSEEITMLENFNMLTSSFNTSNVYNQILSESYDNLEIDFTSFSSHTHFGSAKRKLENFKIKVKDIENSIVEISHSLQISQSGEVNKRRLTLFERIDNITNGMTPYEKWLYSDGQLTITGSAPGMGPDYSYTTPINSTNSTKHSKKFGFNTVYEISGSGSSAVVPINVFNDYYYVENEPFFNNSGSFYLSFLALGDSTVSQSSQHSFYWKNSNVEHIPALPPETLYTESISNPGIKSGSWQRYVFLASASYWRPSSSNASIGGAGGLNITGEGAEIQLLSGSNVSGSYPIVAGAQYQYLANQLTGSGAGFTGSILPAGELFNIRFSGSAQTSSFITDVRVTRNNPKNIFPFFMVHSTGSSTFKSWYDGLYTSASLYDDQNIHSLINNLPAYIRDEIDGKHLEMQKFVDMTGEHFDVIRAYVKGFETFNKRGYIRTEAAPSNITPVLLQNFGWDANQIYSGSLEDYFGGSYEQKYSVKSLTEEYWNKVLNNLIPIYKAKGTLNSVNYYLNTIGWPNQILRIREHGASTELTNELNILTEDASNMIDGVGDQEGGNINYTTNQTNLYSYLFHKSKTSKLDLPWWTDSAKPNTVQFVMKGVDGSTTTQSLLEVSGGKTPGVSSWDLNLIPKPNSSSFAKVQFRLNKSFTGSAALDSTYMMESSYYKMQSNNFWNVALVRESENQTHYPTSQSTDAGLPNVTYRLMVGHQSSEQPDAIDVMNVVSMSVTSSTALGANANQNWFTTGSIDYTSSTARSSSRMTVGRTFTGSMAEFRTWTTPLSMSKFKQHILNKQSVVGNHMTSSQDELIYHFKLQENTTSGSIHIIQDANPTNIKDYSINKGAVTTAQNVLYDIDEIDRVAFTVKADGTEVNENNIILADSSSLSYIGDLNPHKSSFLSPFDRLENKRTVSSHISIVRSPQDILNDFFINNMSDFSVSDMMGDPEDVYNDGYAELNKFFTDIVNNYGIRLEPNKYIRGQLKIFNETIIDRIKKLLPARTTIDDIGIEFKPSFLEKNKIKGYKIQKEQLDYKQTQESGIRVLSWEETDTADTHFHFPKEKQDVDTSKFNRSKSARKFADINVLQEITQSSFYGVYHQGLRGGFRPTDTIQLTSHNANTGSNVLNLSSSISPLYIGSIDFFAQPYHSSSVSSSKNGDYGQGTPIISTTAESPLYLIENVNHNGMFKQTPIVLDDITTISGTAHIPYSGSDLALREDVPGLFDYKEFSKTWGTASNSTHFVTFTDYLVNQSFEPTIDSLVLQNRYHYETRYKFITIGDTQTVSGSAASISSSHWTTFESESFFKGIENITIDSTNGIRENGTTVRLIDTFNQTTKTGSNDALYLDDTTRYPNNHSTIVGTSNRTTPSFKNSFFEGIQNGSDTQRDIAIYSEVPEVNDVATASFYTVTVTGENTLTVGS